MVDDNRPKAGWHPVENPRQCRNLVQARQDHVNDHGSDVITKPAPALTLGPYKMENSILGTGRDFFICGDQKLMTI